MHKELKDKEQENRVSRLKIKELNRILKNDASKSGYPSDVSPMKGGKPSKLKPLGKDIE